MSTAQKKKARRKRQGLKRKGKDMPVGFHANLSRATVARVRGGR